MHSTIYQISFEKEDTQDALWALNYAVEHGQIDYYQEYDRQLTHGMEEFAKYGLTLDPQARTITLTDKNTLLASMNAWKRKLHKLVDTMEDISGLWPTTDTLSHWGGYALYVLNEEVINSTEFLLYMSEQEEGTVAYIGKVFDYHN